MWEALCWGLVNDRKKLIYGTGHDILFHSMVAGALIHILLYLF